MLFVMDQQNKRHPQLVVAQFNIKKLLGTENVNEIRTFR